MSLSRPTNSETSLSKLKITLPKAYGYLTIVQAGSAIVFTSFLVTHLSATALANIGGIELTNKAIILGRVYYQNKFLEPIVVVAALWSHIVSSAAKRGIRLYWKFKKQDERKLTGEVHEKVEKIVTDEKNEQGIVMRQKITTKITTTITESYVSRAMGSLFPYHHAAGYLLIPFVLFHSTISRVLPRKHFGDSSLINATYVTLALRRWPKTSYFIFSALIGLTAYHVTSGLPSVVKVIKGAIFKSSTADKSLPPTSKNIQKYIRTGAIVSTIGLLGTGLLVISGKIGRDPRIPLRSEYLKVYGLVYPQSWVRY